MKKLIPERVIERCWDCPQYTATINFCHRLSMKTDMYHIHPSCPLDDAVSDPCRFDFGETASTGRMVAPNPKPCTSHPRCAAKWTGKTWATCPYGKEWKP